MKKLLTKLRDKARQGETQEVVRILDRLLARYSPVLVEAGEGDILDSPEAELIAEGPIEIYRAPPTLEPEEPMVQIRKGQIVYRGDRFDVCNQLIRPCLELLEEMGTPLSRMQEAFYMQFQMQQERLPAISPVEYHKRMLLLRKHLGDGVVGNPEAQLAAERMDTARLKSEYLAARCGIDPLMDDLGLCAKVEKISANVWAVGEGYVTYRQTPPAGSRSIEILTAPRCPTWADCDYLAADCAIWGYKRHGRVWTRYECVLVWCGPEGFYQALKRAPEGHRRGKRAGWACVPDWATPVELFLRIP